MVSTATQDHGDIRARPQPSAVSGFMVQLHPGSVMMSVVHVTTDGHGRDGPRGLGAGELVLPLKATSVGELSLPLIGRTGSKDLGWESFDGPQRTIYTHPSHYKCV